MMTETDSPNKRRLNPFAFPSETDTRFTLLIVAALMLVFNMAVSAGPDLGLFSVPAVPVTEVKVSNPALVEQGLVEWSQALAQAMSLMAWPGGLILAVLLVATVIYRRYPSHIRRSKNLRLITRAEDAQFFEAVQNLVCLSEVSPAPSIEMAAGSQSVDGQAFGRRNHYALRLGGRLRLLLRQNPASFRAIVLHELAHLANNDVWRAYFAQAIWTAVVILNVVPFVAFIGFNFSQGLSEILAGGLTREEWGLLLTVNLPTVFILLFQFGATLAIVATIRGSLLRVREVYADWRVALWGAEAPLADLLRRNASVAKAGRWGRLWRLHPTTQERLAFLQSPDQLFRVTPELPFFVGVLLPYALVGAVLLWLILFMMLLAGTAIGIQLLVEYLANPLFLVNLIYFLMGASSLATALAIGFGVAYLVAGALGVEVQRETVADMLRGRRGWTAYLGLWRPAGLVAFGFQMGILLTPFSILGLLPDLIGSPLGLSVLLMILLLTVGLACLTWLWLVYARFFARRTLGAHIGALAPQRARRLLTLVASGLLWVLYLPVILGDWIIMDVVNQATGQGPTVVTQLLGILFTAVVIALFLYVATFGATWLLIQVCRLVGRPRCPTCSQVTRQPYVVGQLCKHCGGDLAAWLFTN